MDAEQIGLVQASFDRIAPIAATAGALFYQRLFELDPSLRPLFPSDMRAQSRKLMDMIELVVDGLSHFDRLQMQVQKLGRDHLRYGAQPSHYSTVGAALIWTLRVGLEDAFSPADEAAWALAYQQLASTMLAGATS